MGTGPRGTYVAGGRDGIYFRKYLGGKSGSGPDVSTMRAAMIGLIAGVIVFAALLWALLR